MLRSIFLSALLVALSLQSVFAAAGAFSPEQYRKALWMVTRFYGAQRSGVGPNWLLMDHAYKTSFTRDADSGRDLEGGWFDCGDHVLFGQTFFYSAFMLAKAYDAFPKGFHDLYNGKDYSDYAESGKWGIEGGKPNRIPDLLEELKYATDWIIKATPDGSTFYYEKGEGGKDHNTWVTAGKMSTQPVDLGGEPRKMWKNPNDGPMASFAAATLAIMSRIYREFDTTYAETCLKHAKNAYTYAKAHKSQAAGAGSGGYYGAGNAPANTFNIAAAEMYIATKDNTYKSDISLDKNNVPFHNWAFDYSNPHDIVPYVVAMAVPEDKSALLNAMNSTFITRFTSQKNGEKVATTGNSGWGALRYPANHAFLAALYQEAKGTNDYDQFIYDQVDYILGKNNSKQSFVVGFCEGCTKKATKPHHRNIYLNDENRDAQGMSALTIPARNESFGYMVGGSFNSGDYKDDINNYQYTEGGLDYNAGLVGALAYIVSKVDPAPPIPPIVVDPPDEPEPPEEPDPEPIIPLANKTLLGNFVVRFVGTHEFPAQSKSFTVQIFDLKGNKISTIKSEGQSVRFTPKSKNIYYAVVK
ncbi:MAG: glycoside hydrolase family 9 protein [Fibromonadales bacterium]|nr:glycoside hydrolase family 9 protein [Fibromonadales bacterium]